MDASAEVYWDAWASRIAYSEQPNRTRETFFSLNEAAVLQSTSLANRAKCSEIWLASKNELGASMCVRDREGDR